MNIIRTNWGGGRRFQAPNSASNVARLRRTSVVGGAPVPALFEARRRGFLSRPTRKSRSTCAAKPKTPTAGSRGWRGYEGRCEGPLLSELSAAI